MQDAVRALLTDLTFRLLVALEHRGHFVAHALRRALGTLHYAECADHSESSYGQSDIGVSSFVLGFSEQHHISPFFVVFLFFHAFIFLFQQLTKVATCCTIYIRNILGR